VANVIGALSLDERTVKAAAEDPEFAAALERQRTRELEEAKMMCSIENKEACLMCSGWRLSYAFRFCFPFLFPILFHFFLFYYASRLVLVSRSTLVSDSLSARCIIVSILPCSATCLSQKWFLPNPAWRPVRAHADANSSHLFKSVCRKIRFFLIRPEVPE